MPAVIPIVAAVATAAITALGPTGLALLTATQVLIATTAITVLTSVASFLLSRRAAKRNRNRGAAQANGSRSADQTTRIGASARRVCVGTARMAAAAFPAYDSTPANRFVRIMAINHGRVSQFVQHQLQGEDVSLNGSSFVTGSIDGKWDGKVRILTTNGADDQVAIPQAVTDYSAWTSNHRCRGIALAYVSQDPVEFDDARAGRLHVELDYTAVVRGTDEIYDPRTGATGWTDNAALWLRWYLTYADGFNLATTRLNEAEWMVAADVCDVEIPLLAGGTEKQFRVAGHFDLSEDRNEIVAAMLLNMDAYLTQDSTGRIGIRIGTAAASNLTTLSFDNVLVERLQGGNALKDRRNSVTGLFRDEAQNYIEATSPAQEFALSVAAIGRRTMPLDLRFCPSNTQAQRLCRRTLYDEFESKTGSLQTDLSGLNVYPGDSVVLNYPEAMTTRPLLVVSHDFQTTDDSIFCAMDVQEIHPDREVWNTGLEVSATEAVPRIADGSVLDAPANLALTSEVTSVNASTPTLRGRLTWTPPSDPSVQAEAEIAENPVSGDPVYFGRQSVTASQGVALLTGLSDNTDYLARVRFVGSAGTRTAFTQTGPVTLVISSAALAAPTISVSPTVIDEGESVTVTVTAINSNLVDKVRIFVDASQVAEISVLPGDVVQHVETFATDGTYAITAANVNVSNVQGTLSATVNVTVNDPGP